MASGRPGDTDELDMGGRRLAYAAYGDPDGRPVIFCHGAPGSRVLGTLLDAPAAKRGVRLLAPDRPGIGRSDPAAVGIEEWPADAAALLDHVGADEADVVGFSAGAPFALACHRLARVDHVALLSGAGPPDVGGQGRTQRVVGRLARTAPWLLTPVFALQRRYIERSDPETALGLVADDPPETEAFGPDDIADIVKADVLAAGSRGLGGFVRELGLVTGPWPVDLGAVSVPVTVFQGTRDTNVDPATGEALARRLPEARLERVDSDHLGTLCTAGNRALSGPTPV